MNDQILAWRTFQGDDYRRVRQLGVSSVVTALYDVAADQVWPLDRLQRELREPIEAAGLRFHVVESLPVADEIITGGPAADRLLDIWCRSLENIARVGVQVVTYNWMLGPDWCRTHQLTLPDGSETLAYDEAAAESDAGVRPLPGWLKNVDDDDLQKSLDQHRRVVPNQLWDGLGKFLRRVTPVAEELGVKLALHPDDPPWPVFGIPRIITDAAALDRVLGICDLPANGLCFCTGSLGASPANDLPAMIRRFGSRIYFAHVRNVVRTGSRSFYESAHYEGDLDLCEVLAAFHDVGFSGPMRPDHGHRIWDEQNERPGYYWITRAMGLSYLRGIWQAIAAQMGALRRSAA
jgi:mannonate dehydratase